MICPKCKQSIADTSKFCPECGQALKALATVDQRTDVARPESRPEAENPIEGSYRVLREDFGSSLTIEPGKGVLVVLTDPKYKEMLLSVLWNSQLNRQDVFLEDEERLIWVRVKNYRFGASNITAAVVQRSPGIYNVQINEIRFDELAKIEEGDITEFDRRSTF